ncbi:MAG: SDR family NAD(P)-dependent oxidoreductase [Myxococcales bacterium]|nr:SDR family NAD(P)-dependent oxidoreductase [Myxococcales bacterium]
MEGKRIAVITGANRGLGFGTARELARRGYRVVLTARSREKAEAAAAELRGEGLDVVPEVVDVASDESVRGLVERLRRDHGRVDVLVNNAGAIFEASHDPAHPAGAGTLEVSPATVLRALDNNSVGALRMLQGILPMMNAAGHGRVVNVSSGMGALHDMGSGWPAYRISKTALSAVTRLFALEARGDVKVNAVCPGWVRTDMGGPNATRSLEEGVSGIVIAATLGADGPSGVFLRDGQIIEW